MKKILMLSAILLLIVCISATKNSYAQEKEDSCFCYSAEDVTAIAEVIAENDYLAEENKAMSMKDSLNESIIHDYILQIEELSNINQLKEEQIIKLENKPAQVIDNTMPWYQQLLIILGAASAGYVINEIAK